MKDDADVLKLFEQGDGTVNLRPPVTDAEASAAIARFKEVGFSSLDVGTPALCINVALERQHGIEMAVLGAQMAMIGFMSKGEPVEIRF